MLPAGSAVIEKSRLARYAARRSSLVMRCRATFASYPMDPSRQLTFVDTDHPGGRVGVAASGHRRNVHQTLWASVLRRPSKEEES